MKSNRREFIKGALSGAFGAFLTWAGAVKAKGEKVAQANRSTTTSAAISTTAEQSTPSRPIMHWSTGLDGLIYVSFDNSVMWERYNPGCLFTHLELVDEDEGVYLREVEELEQIEVAPPQGTFIVDGVTWLVSVDDDGFSIISDDGGKTWQDPSELHSLTFVAPPDDLPDDLSDMAARWDTYWEIRGRGNAWCATSPNYGHFVHWSIDGSDEDGQGTFEDPVATEACAQSIADNPPFRV